MEFSIGDRTGIEERNICKEKGVHGSSGAERNKPDLFFPLVLAEICQELFSSLRAHEAKPLPRYNDAIPVRQDRRESPSSRVQRLNVLLNVVCADSWRMPFGGGGNVERG